MLGLKLKVNLSKKSNKNHDSIKRGPVLAILKFPNRHYLANEHFN